MLESKDLVKSIKGVGDKTAALFSKIDVHTVGELIYHYPFRYESYAYPVKIADCSNGELVSIEATVVSTPKNYNAGKFKITEALVKDDTGSLTVKWFNAPFMRNVLKFGDRLIFRGKVTVKGKSISLTQPEYFTKDKYRAMLKSLRPIYPSTEGLGQTMITKSIQRALEETVIKDYLPASVRKKYELEGLRDALNTIHFPEDEKALTRALSRLVFDEFFFFLLNIKRLKEQGIETQNNHVITLTEKSEQMQGKLGYELTEDQKTVLSEIYDDMASDKTMQRLLQGDVGSGKTAVALMTMAAVAFCGKQACIMAPTEVLAKQHFDYFFNMFEGFGIKVAFLSGSMTKAEKSRSYSEIESGEALIIVGTHAAIQSGVCFKELALCVVDEQHRFGVKQREAITLKGTNPHLLLMSATPIPRTYALMLYGDMDISVLAHLPANRKAIKNCVADESMRASVNKFILKEIAQGHQVYVICPLVEESDKMTAAAVNTYVDELRTELGGQANIEALHGKMKPVVKADIMDRFAEGVIDVLVSTTVVEVGINVPNATLMLIENAEKFGLAQLHQIRGRVGRGDSQSYCIFMAGKTNATIKERLDIVANSNDGFHIAGQDMKLRGPGDFFGTRQSGDRQFDLADPLRDGIILKMAGEAVSDVGSAEAEKLLESRNNVVSRGDIMVY